MSAKEKAMQWLRGEIDCDARQLVRDLVDDAAIAALGGGWLPIESAPRDGTRFLCATIIPRHRLLIAMFGAGGILLDERLQPATWPMTHWMPLPAPPSKEG